MRSDADEVSSSADRRNEYKRLEAQAKGDAAHEATNHGHHFEPYHLAVRR